MAKLTLSVDDQAIKRIHTLSQGFPRLINIICDHGLLSGYVKGIDQIDLNVITNLEKRNELPIGILKPPGKDNQAIPDWNVEPEEFTVAAKKSKTKWVWVIIFVLLILITSSYMISEKKSFESIVNKTTWIKEAALKLF